MYPARTHIERISITRSFWPADFFFFSDKYVDPFSYSTSATQCDFLQNKEQRHDVHKHAHSWRFILFDALEMDRS